MHRRTLLRRGLPVALVGLAGCTGNEGREEDGGGDGSGGGGTASDAPTDSPTPTPTPSRTAENGPDPSSATEPGSTATDSPTSTGSPTSTDSPTPTLTPSPEPDQRVVVAPGGEFRFEPERFEIARGDTVLWVWEGTGHNVSDGAKPATADWPGDDETTYPEGHTYAYTFEVAGRYEYHCDPHRSRGMEGSFTVK